MKRAYKKRDKHSENIRIYFWKIKMDKLKAAKAKIKKDKEEDLLGF